MSLITEKNLDSDEQRIPRDVEGLSQLFRLSRYVTELLDRKDIIALVPDEQRSISCKGLALFVQVAGDNLSIAGSMPIWDASIHEVEAEAIDLISKARSVLDVCSHSVPEMSNSVSTVHTQLLHDSKGLTTGAYYSARAYVAITSEFSEVRDMITDIDDVQIRDIRKSTDVFEGAAYVLTAPDSKELQRLCNELLADLTGYNFSGHVGEGMLVRTPTKHP